MVKLARHANLSWLTSALRWCITLALTSSALAGDATLARLPVDLAVTNGLIRWWPNPFDARDEITGQEGVVMGVLPALADGVDDRTPFTHENAWVQLEPAVTNELFTCAFWINFIAGASGAIWQQSRDTCWFLEINGRSMTEFVLRVGDGKRESQLKETVPLSGSEWHHVAVARKQDDTSTIWLDGRRAVDGRTPFAWPRDSRWLILGGGPGGGRMVMHLRDICFFDRTLDDEEIGRLAATGLKERIPRRTPARRAATEVSFPITLSTNVADAQPSLWNHRRLTAEDNLPDNTVSALLQDQKGYLWVGTPSGIGRYDGRRFQSFTSENTPALDATGQNTSCLAEDTDGSIWAGMFGGLVRIHEDKVVAFTNGLPQQFVLNVQPAGDGSLWVAAFNNFVPREPLWLRRYHPEAGRCSAEVMVPGHIRQMIAVTNGVWFATESPQRIFFWDGKSAAPNIVASIWLEKRQVRVAAHGLPSLEPRLQIWTQPQNDKASEWAELQLGVGGPTFFFNWDPRDWRPWISRLPVGEAATEKWLGAFYSLARMRNRTVERLKFTDLINGPEITSLWPDREGGIWFGTDADGLHYMRDKLIRVFTSQNGLYSEDIRTICTAPDGSLWAATADGPCQWTGGSWRPSGRGFLRSLAVDQEGIPWFGKTGTGTLVIQRENRFRQDQNWLKLGLEWQDPSAMRFDRDGALWVICENGVTQINPKSLKQDADGNWVPELSGIGKPAFKRYAIGKELPKIFPLGLVEDLNGAIWIGSADTGGLFCIKNDIIERFTEMEGVPGKHRVPIFRDSDGALWITSETGLTRRNKEQFQTITRKQGLPHDWLIDMIEDDFGYFWLSGKKGIHRVQRAEIESVLEGRTNLVRTLTFGTRDGMLTPECASMHYPTMAKTPDGNIWVATRNGLATFDPRRVSFDTQPLRASVETIIANHQEIPNLTHFTSQTLSLPRGSGERLQIHFGAVSLTAAERIQFRYKLVGYDKEWSQPTDLRSAFYTNLRPRSYLFQVKASNAHGVWNDEATVLSFVIQPFFWQTTAFYVVLAALGAGVTAGIHMRRLALQRTAQEIRHRQMLLDEKTRIAADMHDQLGATLTQIAILGEVAKRQMEDPAQTRSTLERISQAARNVTSGMSELVWATNPRNDTLENLVAYLREQAAAQVQNASFQVNLDFPQTIQDCQVSATFRRNVLLIVREAIHNVLKHSGASELVIRLRLDASALSIEIRDNGKGFDFSPGSRTGNGLVNMKARTTDLGGQFVLKSQPGKGTAIDISVPLNSRSR